MMELGKMLLGLGLLLVLAGVVLLAAGRIGLPQGCIHIYERVAPGAIFSQFEERGVTQTGRLLTTIDEELRKNGPVPLGCGENRATLHSRPRRWARHSLRARLRLAQFSLATLPTRICGYTLGRLPGDIAYKGKNVSFYFPLATCILLSIVLSALFFLISRFR
jgi:hypothetical protein